MESTAADGVRRGASMNSERIPDQYPVNELEGGGFTERTLQNVKDSDGTIIIYSGKLGGGTEQTVRFCLEQQRPHQLLDASKIPTEEAARSVADFVRNQKINILNVAGPRQSEWPEGYDYAFRALDIFLRLRCSGSPVVRSRNGSRTAHRQSVATDYS